MALPLRKLGAKQQSNWNGVKAELQIYSPGGLTHMYYRVVCASRLTNICRIADTCVKMFVGAVKTVFSHGNLCVCIILHLHGAISRHFTKPPQWIIICRLNSVLSAILNGD